MLSDEAELSRLNAPCHTSNFSRSPSRQSSTAGFASYDAQMDDENPMEKANLCKVEILLNGEVVDVLSFIAHADVAASQGRSVCKKLGEELRGAKRRAGNAVVPFVMRLHDERSVE